MMTAPNTKKHILIIDDEPEVLSLLAGYFEDNGFFVSSASDGLKALEMVRAAAPDVIISDLLLPGEHGINVIKTIKEKYFIPVVIITGVYRREELENLMEDYFVEAFFEKPPDLRALLACVLGILNAKAV